MQVLPLGADSPAEHLTAWVDLYADMALGVVPERQRPDEREALAELRPDSEMTPLALLATDGDGHPLGAAVAQMWLQEDRDLASVELVVRGEQRRAGVGTALVRELSRALAAAGRRRAAADVLADSPGAAFASALGARRTQSVTRSRLEVAATDPRRLADTAAAVPAGYTLVRWVDRCPEQLLSHFAAARMAMNDAPHGDTERDDMHWDGARVRGWENRTADRGFHCYTTAAVHEPTGELVAFTELELPGAAPVCGIQEDTAVATAHRGHGLGLVVKAANLAWVREQHPELARVVTWNATDNRHMRAVNERMGFDVCDERWEMELELGAGPAA